MPSIKEFNGQTFHHVIDFPGDGVKDHDYGIISTFYFLERHEFQTLSRSGLGAKDWAKRLLFVGVGLLIPVLGKVVAFFIAFSTTTIPNDKVVLNTNIQLWEIISVVSAFFFSLVLCIIGHFYKNEKDRLIDKIWKRFKGGRNE
jgi:hypothetical protein